MSIKQRLSAVAALVLVGASLTLAACDQEGPAEQAGEEIDEAGEAVGDAVKDATD